VRTTVFEHSINSRAGESGVAPAGGIPAAVHDAPGFARKALVKIPLLDDYGKKVA